MTTRHPFSPWLAPPEYLERTLVGHADVLGDLLDCVASASKSASANHTLLVGPRGIGKTHLLTLLHHYTTGRLQSPPGGRTSPTGWQAVMYYEEEYAGQNTLANFLLALAQKLRIATPSEEAWQLPAEIADRPDREVCDCVIERLRVCQEKKHGRVLVLVDNLQKILQQWPRNDHDVFRSFLSAQSFFLLIGSAPSVFKQIVNQREAFYQFFDVRLVGELSAEEVLELIGNWFREESRAPEFEERREELRRKIPAIRALTGGNPRLILFLCQMATRATFLEIEHSLKTLMEELREYFVRRFDELPDQRRKVLDTLAEMPGPATPTEIAAAARLPVATVNSQLSRLKKDHYISPVKLKPQRATRYDITERLFRLWRQTTTVAGHQRFRILADFLQLYYTPEEIVALYRHHERSLGNLGIAERSEVLRCVEDLFYLQAASCGEVQAEIFKTRIRSLLNLGESEWAESEAAYYTADALKRGDKTAAGVAYLTQFEIHLKSSQYSAAEQDVESLIAAGLNEDAATAASRLTEENPLSARSWGSLGIASLTIDDYARALESFRRAAQLSNDSAVDVLGLAVALGRLGRGAEALPFAEKATVLVPNIPVAWAVLGLAAQSAGEHERAISAFGRVVELEGETASVLSLQGESLISLRRLRDALPIAEKAVSLEPGNAMAWRALGRIHASLGEQERALVAYRRIVELKGEDADSLALQAFALVQLGRPAEALPLAEGGSTMAPANAGVWMVLGLAADGVGDHLRALEAYHKARQLGYDEGLLYYFEGVTLLHLNRYDEAVTCARNSTAYEVNRPVSFGLLATSLQRLGRFEEALRALEELPCQYYTPDLFLHRARILVELGEFDQALATVADAESGGALLADTSHARADILMYRGEFEAALQSIAIAIREKPDNPMLLVDQEILRGCLGQKGPKMESLPADLTRLDIAVDDLDETCAFMLRLAEMALARDDTSTFGGLFSSVIAMTRWHDQEWFGPQVGAFLRRVLDVNPQLIPGLVEEITGAVKEKRVLDLLDPFVQAAQYSITKNVTVLEKLFPEVREVVIEIAERIAPELRKKPNTV